MSMSQMILMELMLQVMEIFLLQSFIQQVLMLIKDNLVVLIVKYNHLLQGQEGTKLLQLLKINLYYTMEQVIKFTLLKDLEDHILLMQH